MTDGGRLQRLADGDDWAGQTQTHSLTSAAAVPAFEFRSAAYEHISTMATVMTAAAVQPSPSPRGRRSVVARSSRLLLLAVALLALAMAMPRAQAAVGDAQIPDGFDHEPVIVSKETIPPRFKAAKIADNVPKGGAPSPAAATTVNGKPSGAAAAAAAASEQLVNSPTVPADGRPAPRHSFSAPFSSRLVPHWELGAGATAETEFIRLTPARQSRTGYAWNSVEVEMSDWEVLMEFSVKGKPNLGGDGFAFWFVERPEILGSVYGSSDFWSGLGIFFDTFNNDNKGPSPLISAVFNDGTLRYDHSSDGSSQALETCSFDFRNRALPTLAKIRYKDQVLSLDIALDRDASGQPKWSACFSIPRMELGVDKYLGVTSHTGDVADSHDILSFQVRDLSAPDADLPAARKRYAEEIHSQHVEHEKARAAPGATPQSVQDDFQHSVIQLLQQIQGEVNLVEQGQLDMQEWVSQQREDALAKAIAEHDALDHPAPVDNARLLEEIKELKQAVAALSSGSVAPAAAAAGAGRPVAVGAPALDAESVRALSASMKDLLAPLSRAAEASEREARELRIAVTAATRRAEETANALAQIKLQLNTIQTSTHEASLLAASSRSGMAHSGAAAGESWVVWLGVVFSAVGVLVLTLITMQHHRQQKMDRYKFM